MGLRATLARRSNGVHLVSMKKWTLGLAACSLLLGAAGFAKAQTTAPNGRSASRWQASFDAFAELDRARAPEAGGVLFVGSSSIRLWEGLEGAFDAKSRVLQRGFGGSRLADCVEYVDVLVTPYRPRLIVLYAGDNDLAEGATPQQVLERFDAFVAAVHAKLPDTRIAYLSIKPSPLRASLLDQAREANALIAKRTEGEAGLDFIDVFSRMLDEQGHPRRELFSADMLHMNADGYALWRGVIADHLAPATRPTQTTAAR